MLAELLLLARLSDLAYLDPNSLDNVLQLSGYPSALEFTPISFGPVEAYVFSMPRLIVVSVRGTEMRNIEDWITNFDARTTARYDLPGKTHHGFTEAANGLFDDVLDVVTKIGDIGEAFGPVLYFTGHSQGGAVAQILSLLFRHDYRFRAVRSVTFGQPRVGNGKFAREAYAFSGHATNTRVVNNNDIVPHLPPALNGYRHCGTLRYIDSGGRLHTSRRPWGDRLRGIARALLTRGVTIDSIADHNRENYIQRLATLCYSEGVQTDNQSLISLLTGRSSGV